MRISFTCEVCGLEKTRMISNKPDTKRPRFCGRMCKAQWQSSSFKGENNPNYGKSWNDIERDRQSRLIKSKITVEYREKAGSANRGQKFSQERVRKMHEHRSSDSYRRVHTSDTKSKIGQKSKQKWTAEYRAKHRERMESNGHWIQSSQKDPYRVYYLAANWIGSMVSYLSEDDLELFNEHGFYNSSNKNGYVRDHIVSRKVGWLFNLPPELLRHPANLQLISHSNNIKKGWQERAMQRSDLEPMVIDLISRIESWTTSWPEQELCLTLITQMKGGVRWETFS